MPRASDKQERLLDSADHLILKQGFKQTTLADIAEDSGVPLGNVYYYYKTKESIGKTVIENRLTNLKQLLEQCTTQETPKARLIAFLDYPLNIQATLTQHGCPLGTLAYELSRTDSFLKEQSKPLISEVLNWCTQQFALMNLADPKAHALTFFGQLQGMSLIANTLDDPEVVTTVVKQLRDWLNTL